MNEDVEEAIEITLSTNEVLVKDWLAKTPGAWGALADKAVLAHRRLVGRRLTENERRLVWSALWDRLSLTKRTDGRDSNDLDG